MQRCASTTKQCCDGVNLWLHDAATVSVLSTLRTIIESVFSLWRKKALKARYGVIYGSLLCTRVAGKLRVLWDFIGCRVCVMTHSMEWQGPVGTKSCNPLKVFCCWFFYFPNFLETSSTTARSVKGAICFINDWEPMRAFCLDRLRVVAVAVHLGSFQLIGSYSCVVVTNGLME